MALINSRILFKTISKALNIDLLILLENKNYILKNISHLGDFIDFNADATQKAISKIPNDFYANIEADKDYFNAVLFAILKKLWGDLHGVI